MLELCGMNEETKKCAGECGQTKVIECFELRTDTGKRRGVCRECISKQARERYQMNAEENRAKSRASNAANPQANRDRVKRWRKENPEKRWEQYHREDENKISFQEHQRQTETKRTEREETDRKMMESGVVGAMKLCTGPCGLEKPLREFYYRRDNGKHRSECIECHIMLNQERKMKPKSIETVVVSEPGFKRCTGKCGLVKAESEFYFRGDNKKYMSECKVCANSRSAEYQKNHRPEIKEYRCRYEKDNKDDLNDKRAKRERDRKKKDLTYKFLSSLRCSIERAFKGNHRSIRTVEYLGCTIEKCIMYIESQWKAGMDWNNWSKCGWQIDHIEPIAAIRSLDDIEQIKKVFHYTNLQPLWNEEHKIKTAQDMKYIRKLKQDKSTQQEIAL